MATPPRKTGVLGKKAARLGRFILGRNGSDFDKATMLRLYRQRLISGMLPGSR